MRAAAAAASSAFAAARPPPPPPSRLLLLLLLLLPALALLAHRRATAPAAAAPARGRAAPAPGCAARCSALGLPMANDQPPCLVRPVALLFGDSLTERSLDPDGGWGAALAHRYARKLDVVNRGFGGYNSRWGLHLLREVLDQAAAGGQRVALMTIWFGANDAALPGRSAERQHVPADEYAANLAAMVAMARRAGVQRILVITPPPVDDEARVRHQQQRMGITTPVPPDRTLEASRVYADAAVSALSAGADAVPVLDLHTALQVVPDWRATLLDDGLHFTPAGSRAVWAALAGTLEARWPELSLPRVPNHMPWWDAWDTAAPDAFWAATLPALRTAGAGALVDSGGGAAAGGQAGGQAGGKAGASG
ncbi:GDSL esterase/lipase [Scenedesmus sp. PABB004]|nr:GDSL esterase/lipase [Scenedesmus sp. PABB004]